MKTAIKLNRSAVLAGAAATLAIAAMGFAGAAQARDNVYWSVGVGGPGVGVNVGNGFPVYAPQPVYVQPAPVYYQSAPVYVQPAPVYYRQRPVVVAPYPVYRTGWERPGYYGERWRGRGEWRREHRRHDHDDHDD